jgi:hypothetical protein
MIIGGILIVMAFAIYLSSRSPNETINKYSLKYYKLRWRGGTPF